MSFIFKAGRLKLAVGLCATIGAKARESPEARRLKSSWATEQNPAPQNKQIHIKQKERVGGGSVVIALVLQA